VAFANALKNYGQLKDPAQAGPFSFNLTQRVLSIQPKLPEIPNG